jgi:hypothetical protein
MKTVILILVSLILSGCTSISDEKYDGVFRALDVIFYTKNLTG